MDPPYTFSSLGAILLLNSLIMFSLFFETLKTNDIEFLMLGTALGSWTIQGNQTYKYLCPYGADILVGRDRE